MTLYPLTFNPIFKERVWGGRRLEQLFHKSLPTALPIGESWEITDRPEGVSTITNGPLAGHTLRSLMEKCPKDILGTASAIQGRFPLLVKILDARETLSLQVHPSAASAREYGGETKTEMWYILEADPDAEIFAGLKRGVNAQEFETRLRDGTVAECIHRIKSKPHVAMFLPSGRIHALGAGHVLFEVQENSDTTYRVFDWNRVGLDGKPRELHIPQSLASIDFHDFEPGLASHPPLERDGLEIRPLVDAPEMRVEIFALGPGNQVRLKSNGRSLVLGLAEGQATVLHSAFPVELAKGDFCLVPACLDGAAIRAMTASKIMAAWAGHRTLPCR